MTTLTQHITDKATECGWSEASLSKSLGRNLSSTSVVNIRGVAYLEPVYEDRLKGAIPLSILSALDGVILVTDDGDALIRVTQHVGQPPRITATIQGAVVYESDRYYGAETILHDFATCDIR